MPHLDQGKPALTIDFSDEDAAIVKDFFLLSSKRTIYACNVAEDELAGAIDNPDSHPQVATRPQVRRRAQRLRSRRHLRPHRGGTQRPLPRGSRRVPRRHGRDRLRRLRPDPRRLSPARPAHLPHHRRAGNPRLDHPRRRQGPRRRRRHPHRFRARLHRRGNRPLRRPRRRSAPRTPPRKPASSASKARNTSSRTAT